MAPTSKRSLILAAAATVVEKSGAANLTIDSVAVQAGVSKGGVLYHFPTKQALLEGMLEHLMQQMEQRTQENARKYADYANASLMARIAEQFDQTQTQRSMSRAILAAAAQDPELIAPARAVVRAAFSEAAGHSTPSEMGWVLQAAAEGLRFLGMLNLSPLTAAQRRRLHDYLLLLAQEHAV